MRFLTHLSPCIHSIFVILSRESFNYHTSYILYRMSMKHIMFVLNPISGTVSKAHIPELIDTYLDKNQFTYEFAETQYAGHATELARRAAEDGIDIVCAIGGDGTVNEVGRALVDTNTAMAILPCGSGNGLARHLLLPMDLKKCIDIINRCSIERLDSGMINEHAFFCTCGMGFDAFISMKFAEAGKRGLITYAENVLTEGLSYQPETYEIEDELGSKTYKAFLVSVANASQYGNNAYIAPQASMSDGLLDVIIMEPFDILEAPQVAIELFNKTLDKNKKIKTFRAKHIHIHRKSAGIIHYDGDPKMSDADVDIHIKPRSISIVTNPDGNKAQRQPNMVQNAASELFYDFDTMREKLIQQTRNLQAVNRKILRKLNL